MNKYLDKLLEKSIENGWYDGYTIDTDASEIQKVLLEFGKQCFEAGRDSKKIYNPEKDGKLEMITIIVEYKSFEDYLKSLENGD